MIQAEYSDEEDYGEEEYEDEEEPQEAITHCVHRIPAKGQKVNIELYYDCIQVEKVEGKTAKKVEQSIKKQFAFIASLFKNSEAPVQKEVPKRHLTFYEGRLLVMKSIPEQVRNYGSHFSVKDKDRLQMPRIVWNAVILSARNIRDLLSIKLLNYKQVVSNQVSIILYNVQQD